MIIQGISEKIENFHADYQFNKLRQLLVTETLKKF